MTVERKPKPTALKAIQGTYRPDRANLSEPKPRAVIPPCPKFLQGDAREQYRETVKGLARLGSIAQLDSTALSKMCLAEAEYIHAMERVKRTGVLITSPNGSLILNPYLTIANQAAKKVQSLVPILWL